MKKTKKQIDDIKSGLSGGLAQKARENLIIDLLVEVLDIVESREAKTIEREKAMAKVDREVRKIIDAQ